MKTCALIFALFCALASDANQGVKFVEMKRFHEDANLPPRLMATFHLACNQDFLQVIRHEAIDPISQTAVISIGGLIAETQGHCDETAREITVPAGHTYSGRHYVVNAIKAAD